MAGAGEESDRPSGINDQCCSPLERARVVRGYSSTAALRSDHLNVSIQGISFTRSCEQPRTSTGPLVIRSFAAAMEAKLCVLLSLLFSIC
jgi:hypothetical protein